MVRVPLMGKESIHARKAAIEATASVVGKRTHARTHLREIRYCMNYHGSVASRLYTRRYVNHVRI